MSDIPVKEIGELLDEVSGKIPKLLTGVMDSLYSAEAGKKIGQASGDGGRIGRALPEQAEQHEQTEGCAKTGPRE